MNLRFSRALPPGGLAHARPDDLEAFPSGLGHAASGATYSSADKVPCMRTGVYLPCYVERLTCLEMERDVRKMQQEERFGAGPWNLPRVRRTINNAGR